MGHAFEIATSGRAKCRGCGEAIARGDFRLGERLPNPFATEGEMTLWFHPWCGAYKRPEVFLEAATPPHPDVEQLDEMLEAASFGEEHRRVPRISGVERSPTGRARCRSCREMIEKDAWRIRLVFYEEGMFNPSGFMHVACSDDYFETTDILERLLHFAPPLTPEETEELAAILSS